jgi:hypothetical protein
MIGRLTGGATMAMLLVALAPAVSSAHVGSPDVVYDGKAGPYDVRVIVRVPTVVPGLADVTVRILRGAAREVHIQPVFWRTGVSGSPSPDLAKEVPGASGLYSGQLWLMARGAYSVYVSVDGRNGHGTASVPVMSVATGRLGMSHGLGALLITLGFFLIAGLITIVYVAAGEGVTEPGLPIDATRRRRARLIASIAAPVLALALLGGAKWWGSVDRIYQTRMYRPLPTRASVVADPGKPVLRFEVLDSAGGQLTLDPLVPDHGKLMHLFVIDSASMRAFAHLHPMFNDTGAFVTPAPPLPPGRYRLFGDITTETGQTRTLTGMVSLTRSDSVRASAERADPDDAWTTTPGVVRRAAAASVDTLADRSTMEWLADSTAVRAGSDATLRFRVRDPSGALATLEPYLGMAAHAVIARTDGSVFVHLHPTGTISMAAQQVFASRDRGDTTPAGRLRLASDSVPMISMTGDFSFPYLFPQRGTYRLWVQVRRNGRVLTGSYDLTL